MIILTVGLPARPLLTCLTMSLGFTSMVKMFAITLIRHRRPPTRCGSRLSSLCTRPRVCPSIMHLVMAHSCVLIDIGEVWANILHNVYATLVARYGFDANARTDPTLQTGNAVFLHLFIDGLLLQPCNPTCEWNSLRSRLSSRHVLTRTHSRFCS
jgi:hypothetical protein